MFPWQPFKLMELRFSFFPSCLFTISLLYSACVAGLSLVPQWEGLFISSVCHVAVLGGDETVAVL